MSASGSKDTGQSGQPTTRLDRMKHWAANHPVLAPVSFLLAFLAAFGGAFGFGKNVYDALRTDGEMEAPIQLHRDDLLRETNDRFGFSFDRPRQWGRTLDPLNADGNRFEAHDGSGAALSAYGANAFSASASDDPREELAAEVELTERFARDNGAEVAESGYYGLRLATSEGDPVVPSQIPGWRLLIEGTDEESGKDGISIEVLARWRGRTVHMVCSAPRDRFATYREACDELVSGLVLHADWGTPDS